MKLHFNRADFDKLIAHTKAATKHKPLYGEPDTAKPGLWLVGDQGVYLMSNGDPGLELAAVDPEAAKDPKAAKMFVVYANEINPNKVVFDRWWENKRKSFGSDDGCEFLPLSAFERLPPGIVAIDVSKKGIGVYELPPPKKGKAADPMQAVAHPAP